MDGVLTTKDEESQLQKLEFLYDVVSEDSVIHSAYEMYADEDDMTIKINKEPSGIDGNFPMQKDIWFKFSKTQPFVFKKYSAVYNHIEEQAGSFSETMQSLFTNKAFEFVGNPEYIYESGTSSFVYPLALTSEGLQSYLMSVSEIDPKEQGVMFEYIKHLVNDQTISFLNNRFKPYVIVSSNGSVLSYGFEMHLLPEEEVLEKMGVYLHVDTDFTFLEGASSDLTFSGDALMYSEFAKTNPVAEYIYHKKFESLQNRSKYRLDDWSDLIKDSFENNGVYPEFWSDVDIPFYLNNGVSVLLYSSNIDGSGFLLCLEMVDQYYYCTNEGSISGLAIIEDLPSDEQFSMMYQKIVEGIYSGTFLSEKERNNKRIELLKEISFDFYSTLFYREKDIDMGGAWFDYTQGEAREKKLPGYFQIEFVKETQTYKLCTPLEPTTGK